MTVTALHQLDIPWDTGVVSHLFIRNRYRECLFCGAGHVVADHVHPRSHGGRSIPVNLAPLCPMCNLVKSDYWAAPGCPAWENYTPFPGLDDIGTARAILLAEVAWLNGQFPAWQVEAEVWHCNWDGSRG